MDRLALENVSVVRRRRGDVTVVEGVNLRMSPGQVMGILGPNGCGKTSLVRAIAGFIPPMKTGEYSPGGSWWNTTWGDESRRMSGRVLLDGKDVTLTPPGERHIALVPQNLALYPDKTVLENIAFPLLARGVAKPEARSRATEMAKWMRVDSVISSRPAEISGGQQQRVAIGRALVGEPRLVLLDEPLASLDVLSKGEILTFISRVLRERKASAIYVTHDPDEAATLCDTVAFINEQRVQQIASPTDAYNGPETLFVARMFSGFANIIHGRIDESGVFISANGGGWDLPLLFDQEGIPPTRSAWLAGRPRAFCLSPADGRGVSGKVTGLFSQEGRSYVRAELAPGVTLACPVTGTHALGSIVTVGIAPRAAADLRLFDEEGRVLKAAPRAEAGQSKTISL